MNTTTELPSGYEASISIEIEKSKILSRFIKTIQVVLAVIMFGAASVIMGTDGLTQMDEVAFHLVILMLGMMSYTILHELIRGFLMRGFSGQKPIFRFSGPYAHVGSPAYFSKGHELAIMIIPVVVTVALSVFGMCKTSDMSWMWVFYLILMVCVAGSVSDIYVIVRVIRESSDILIQNVGSTFVIFKKEQTQK